MKKILIIHESLEGGGAEKVLINLINNINFELYSITLLLINNRGIYLNRIPSKLRYKYIYKTRRGWFKRLLAKIGMSSFFQKIELTKAIRNEHFNVTISYMEGPPSKYHSLITKLSNNNITWVHTDLINNPWSTKYFSNLQKENDYYTKMNKIIFVSHKARESFNSKYNADTKKQLVIPNIIDKTEITTLAKEQTIKTVKFTICSVGRLSKEKRFDRLIEACKLLKSEGIDFDCWILGTGKLESELKLLISKLDLENNVHLLGFKINPYPYIKACDIYVMSSDVEGYPTVICEALTLGKPIISTAITGTTELLGKSEYGILTQLTPESIYKAIRYLLHNTDERNKLAEQAALHSQIFDTQHTMQLFYKAIEE